MNFKKCVYKWLAQVDESFFHSNVLRKLHDFSVECKCCKVSHIKYARGVFKAFWSLFVVSLFVEEVVSLFNKEAHDD